MKCSHCNGTGTMKQNSVGDFYNGTSGTSAGLSTKVASKAAGNMMSSKKKGKVK